MRQHTFASLLKTRRAVSGLTQEELARKAGVSSRAVSYLESGIVRRPRRDTIDALATALGLDERLRDELRARARWHGNAENPSIVGVGTPRDQMVNHAHAGPIWPADESADPGPRMLPASFQLPPDSPTLVGLCRETEEVLSDLERPGAVGPIAIVGMPGVGASTLAIHIGHQLRDRFPDAQLFVDLHAGGRPMQPRHALAYFLRALGVPVGRIPSQLHERAALFRSLLTGRRCLIVLDNATDERQVRPMLPSGPDCLVLIDGGNAMAGLDVRRRIMLGPQPPAESLELLARIAGHHRLAEDPVACAELVRLSGGLPLAVRIAAARLAGRPDQDTATLVYRLAVAERRIDEFSAGDLTVRASFARRYSVLDHGTRTLFHALGRIDSSSASVDGWADLTTAQIVDLTGLSVFTATRGLERLLDVNLLRPGPGVDRYQVHELIRLYAMELGHPIG
jgi:transcriptional regulator with XRE-family HTH domain